MKVCLTYANWRMRGTQRINGRKIIASGFFDKVILTSPRDLSGEFVRDYKHILKYRRGAGYWVWKPYIIKQTLMSLSSEDILCYIDADFHFCKPIDPAIEMMDKWQQDIMPFGSASPFIRESTWTKKDAFMLMNCDKPEWMNSPQRGSSPSLWRKGRGGGGGSTLTLAFLDEWLHYAKDARIITDLPSQYPNDANFKKHRHDQSIFSLLNKKYGIRAFTYPTKVVKQDSEYHFVVLYNPLRPDRPETFLPRHTFLLRWIGYKLRSTWPFCYLFSLYDYLVNLRYPLNNSNE